MNKDRAQMVLPDLFSPPSSSFLRQPPSSTVISDTTTAPRRPEDLPSAIKHLTDQELAQLHTVVLDELQRRGKKPPSNENSRKRRSEKAVVPLTIGKLNARAQFRVRDRVLEAHRPHPQNGTAAWPLGAANPALDDKAGPVRRDVGKLKTFG
jgi:hypothetical protein